MLQGNEVPEDFVSCALLFHDWPHEDPPMMDRFIKIFQADRQLPTIPSAEQAHFILNKTVDITLMLTIITLLTL